MQRRAQSERVHSLHQFHDPHLQEPHLHKRRSSRSFKPAVHPGHSRDNSETEYSDSSVGSISLDDEHVREVYGLLEEVNACLDNELFTEHDAECFVADGFSSRERLFELFEMHDCLFFLPPTIPKFKLMQLFKVSAGHGRPGRAAHGQLQKSTSGRSEGRVRHEITKRSTTLRTLGSLAPGFSTRAGAENFLRPHNPLSLTSHRQSSAPPPSTPKIGRRGTITRMSSAPVSEADHRIYAAMSDGADDTDTDSDSSGTPPPSFALGTPRSLSDRR